MTERFIYLTEKFHDPVRLLLFVMTLWFILNFADDNSLSPSYSAAIENLPQCNQLSIEAASEADIRLEIAQKLLPGLYLTKDEPANPAEVVPLFQVSPLMVEGDQEVRYVIIAWYFTQDYGAKISILGQEQTLDPHVGDIEDVRFVVVKTGPHTYRVATMVLAPHGDVTAYDMQHNCFPEELYASEGKHALYRFLNPAGNKCDQKRWGLYRETCNKGPLVYPELTRQYEVGGPDIGTFDPLVSLPELLAIFNGNSAWDRYFCGGVSDTCGPEAFSPFADRTKLGFAPYGEGKGWGR